jgi:DNA uptake protein ComE-like DNA-binding protein
VSGQAFPSPAPREPAAPAPEPPPPPAPAAAAAAQDATGPRALNVVDLNTATLAELNALQGGGSIGRAIIQKRPYASVDQLLSKRVLSRATYEKIKDQVTVR